MYRCRVDTVQVFINLRNFSRLTRITHNPKWALLKNFPNEFHFSHWPAAFNGQPALSEFETNVSIINQIFLHRNHPKNAAKKCLSAPNKPRERKKTSFLCNHFISSLVAIGNRIMAGVTHESLAYNWTVSLHSYKNLISNNKSMPEWLSSLLSLHKPNISSECKMKGNLYFHYYENQLIVCVCVALKNTKYVDFGEHTNLNT